MTRTGTTALTLSDEIRQRFDEFSRSQKDVGQYIVDHLEEAAFHTAEELARRANTSSSTVVRFAQALGFDGFPELQAAARDEYRRARDGGEGHQEISAPPPGRNFPLTGENLARDSNGYDRTHSLRRDPSSLRRVLALAEGRGSVHRLSLIHI